MLATILSAYGLNLDECVTVPFGTGLINHTWKIVSKDAEYILQRINHQIFTQPFHIAENIQATGKYLNGNFPHYLFIEPVKTKDHQSVVYIAAHGYFRMFPFVNASVTYDTVTDAKLAFEAARQFGRFTKYLAGFPIAKLHATLPDFHNLSLRYTQFEMALVQGNKERIAASADSIAFIKNTQWIVDEYDRILQNPAFKLRVTHHDTKISNVLFDNKGKGLCVIDLDTVMPGYFISDVGDMIRTYLSPVSEEEADYSKIAIREDYFKAIVEGYLTEMLDELTEEEVARFVYAGEFMIYMQATRFLTDYLNSDVYYGSKYEGHNLIRANNQIELLKRLFEKKELLNKKIADYFEMAQEPVK